MDQNDQDKNDTNKIAELNDQEAEQVVGGKRAVGGKRIVAELNTLNSNASDGAVHEQAAKI